MFFKLGILAIDFVVCLCFLWNKDYQSYIAKSTYFFFACVLCYFIGYLIIQSPVSFNFDFGSSSVMLIAIMFSKKSSFYFVYLKKRKLSDFFSNGVWVEAKKFVKNS